MAMASSYISYNFDCCVHHLAVTEILKYEAMPTSERIGRLLELFSMYSFNLYHVKGKDVVLSDFLAELMTVSS